MVIDSHIHLYPPEVFADPGAWGVRQGERWWTQCVVPPGLRSLQGWATIDDLLRDMDEAGVDHAVMLGWYWENQATAELQNGWFAEWVAAHPDRLSGFAAAVPGTGHSFLDATRRALDAGLRGVGEMFPQAQGFSFKDETWGALMALAREYDVPATLHVTDPLSTTPASFTKETPLTSFIDVARDFPNNTFILAHWGGGIPFYELNRKLRPLLKNVVYDTAASALLYDKRVFRQVCDIIGPERILFGSDYPLLTHPRLTQEPTFTLDLHDARSSGLDERELELILGKNAQHLLKLAVK